MNERDTPARLERYVEELRASTGVDPVVREVVSPANEAGRILAIIHRGYPEPDCSTGFTYGLSLAEHADWGSARRELTITLRSGESDWLIVPARAVEALRGISAFNRGRVIGHAEHFVGRSGMSSLLLGDPALPGWEHKTLELGGGDLGGPDEIDFVGVFLLHASEREFAKKNGVEALWALPWDRLDPMRSAAV